MSKHETNDSELSSELFSQLWDSSEALGDTNADSEKWFYEIRQLILDDRAKHVKEIKTVNRFEVINHLSDGSGRETVVWKDSDFTVETSMQDDNRTMKVFLLDIEDAVRGINHND